MEIYYTHTCIINNPKAFCALLSKPAQVPLLFFFYCFSSLHGQNFCSLFHHKPCIVLISLTNKSVNINPSVDYIMTFSNFNCLALSKVFQRAKQMKHRDLIKSNYYQHPDSIQTVFQSKSVTAIY